MMTTSLTRFGRQVDVRQGPHRDSFRGWKHYTRIPFTEKASSFDGCNCWGLIALVYRIKYKIKLNLYHSQYLSATDRVSIKQLLSKEYDEWVPVKEPVEGDVIKIRLRGSPFHVALYIGNMKMLHVERCSTYPTTPRIDSIIWRSRILGFYRHKERF